MVLFDYIYIYFDVFFIIEWTFWFNYNQPGAIIEYINKEKIVIFVEMEARQVFIIIINNITIIFILINN